MYYSDIVIIKTFYMTTELMEIYNVVKHSLFHILIIFLKFLHIFIIHNYLFIHIIYGN